MTTQTITKTLYALNPEWLTGPIFDKELRVASRRKRNYFLRFAYLIAMTGFVIFAWLTSIGLSALGGSVLMQSSRMAAIGETVIITIIWFQFIAMQLIALVKLSVSISDEVNKRTLGVLLTTPITSLQLVAGKFLSNLLQMFLLLALSLPLLAIVRVFGGVQWEFVIGSLAVTLTAMLFAASISLLLSVILRKAVTVMVVAIIILCLIYLLLPILAFDLYNVQNPAVRSAIYLINPFLAIIQLQKLSTTITSFSWQIHCLFMLGATSVFLCLSVWRMRKTALHEAFQHTGASIKRKLAPWVKTGKIKRVKGSPIIWKEMRRSFFVRRLSVKTWLLTLGGILIISIWGIITYIYNNGIDIMSLGSLGLIYMTTQGLSLIAYLRTGVLAAGSITREKEGKTLPILLATPLTDWQIIYGKGFAAVWRNIYFWGSYLILILITAIANREFYLNSNALIHLLFSILHLINGIYLITCIGLYFSSLMKTSTGAIIATIVTHIGLQYFCCGMLSFNIIGALRYGPGPIGIIYVFHLVSIPVIILLASRLAYGAKLRLRRNIFQQ